MLKEQEHFSARPSAVSKELSRPMPWLFADYRAFLRSMITYLKATDAKFSYRFFSRRAGYSSPNFLKLVAEGKRNLSNESIDKFGRALELREREQEAFELMVFMDQAKSDDERNRYAERLQRIVNGGEAYAPSGSARAQNVNGVTVRLSREQYENVTQRIASLFDELTDGTDASGDDTLEGGEVFQLAFQATPLMARKDS